MSIDKWMILWYNIKNVILKESTIMRECLKKFRKIFFVIPIIILFITSCYKEPLPQESNDIKIDHSSESQTHTDLSDLQQKNNDYHGDETAPIDESISNEDKLIDKNGCIFDINSKFEFPKSDMLIKKVKLVYDPFAGYLMYLDFDVINKCDTAISWRIQYSGNLLGYFNSDMLVNKEIGGNDNDVFDDETFDGERKRMGAVTLNPNETYSGYKLGIFSNLTEDIKEIKLKETDPMSITLYYKEDDVRYEFEIKLNDHS